MVRPFEPSHLYLQVRNEIARRIAREEYPAGSLLPNEFSLANEMQVSVGTIRKAVEMLNAEKLVTRSQGRGTIVGDRQSADFRSNFDRIRDVEGRPITWIFHELRRQVREANEVERERLHLRKNKEIIEIERLRETNGQVVMREYSRLPLDIFGEIGELAPQEATVENLSFLRGVHVSGVDEKLTLKKAGTQDAEQFDIPKDTIIVRLDRIVHDGGGIPIEWRISHCNLETRQYVVPEPVAGKEAKGFFQENSRANYFGK